MKKKRKKAVLVILIICLVVGFGLFILNAMARMTFTESITGESIKAFYQEDRNTLDGIYVGSSAAYRTWDGHRVMRNTVFVSTIWGLTYSL
jgi:hypothetical protein